MLDKLKMQGITIVVSTPYMDEATLCDRIALIQNGRIMSVDTPDNIIEKFPKTLFAAKADNIYKLLQDLRNNAEVESCYAFGEYLHLTLKADDANTLSVMQIAGNQNPAGFETKVVRPTIEDSFIRLMNEYSNNEKANAK
ncbi:daunorubicin resistance ABC transporter, ATP-binding protein [compost metagenome]